MEKIYHSNQDTHNKSLDTDPERTQNLDKEENKKYFKYLSSKLAKVVMQGIYSTDFENKIDGGFTVNIVENEAYYLGESKGYAVGGFGPEGKIPKEYLDNDEKKCSEIISAYIDDNYELIFNSESRICLGGWVPTEDDPENKIEKGCLYLDITMIFEDEKEAAKNMIERGQACYVDFQNTRFIGKEEAIKMFPELKNTQEGKKIIFRANENNSQNYDIKEVNG